MTRYQMMEVETLGDKQRKEKDKALLDALADTLAVIEEVMWKLRHLLTRCIKVLHRWRPKNKAIHCAMWRMQL